MPELLPGPALQRMLIASVLVAVCAGVVGTYVVVKRMSSVTGGLAHASFGGVGLGFLLGFDPLVGAGLFGVASAVGIGTVHRHLGSALDTAVSIVWAGGMALGILLLAFAPGDTPHLEHYLFGSLPEVSWRYVGAVALLDLLVVAVAVGVHPALQAVAFDEEFAEVVGLRVTALWLGLMTMVALTIVVLIRIVGVILAIALLTMPPDAARRRSSTLAGTMAGGALVAATCAVGGLLVARGVATGLEVEPPVGPIIILFTLVAWGVLVGTHRRTPAR